MTKLRTSELVNLTSSELVELVQEERNASVELGVKWAEANKKFKDIKELLPSFLAEITLYHMGDEVTQSQAKLEALKEDRYQKQIKEMNEAEHQARLLEVEYRAHIKTLEALSAISYLRNTEAKLAR